MKANKSPEKIYIHPDICGSGVLAEWMERPLGKQSVEYIRSDAFIKKACDDYCKICKMPNCRSRECQSIRRFREYLETI